MNIIQKPSPNHGNRKGTGIDAIILHDTISETAESAISWFQNKESAVSAHYVVDRSGQVYQCVDTGRAAWHAGESNLWNQPDCNRYSVGVELVSTGKNGYTDEQILSLILLCVDLCFEFHIPLNRIVGHKDVALPRGRKKDPSSNLNMARLLVAIGAHLAEKIHIS